MPTPYTIRVDSSRQLTDDMVVQNLWTRLRRYGRATTADSVRKHDDDADEQPLKV